MVGTTGLLDCMMSAVSFVLKGFKPCILLSRFQMFVQQVKKHTNGAWFHLSVLFQ